MKKKRIPRKRSAFFAFVFAIAVLFVFSGCSKTDDSLKGETDFSLANLNVVEPEKKASQIGLSQNIVPDSFTILRQKNSDNTVYVLEEGADLLELEIYKRNTRLSAEYGFFMTENVTGDIVSRAKNDVYSGSHSYDMFQFTGETAASLITSGVLADLATYSAFDKSFDGYHKSVIDSLSIQDRTYIVAGDATPSLMLNTSCVLLNTEIEKKLDDSGKLSEITGGLSLTELASNGKFTTDIMLACSRTMADLNGNTADGTEMNASVAASSIRVSPDKALALFLGNGLSFYKIDKVTDEIMPVEIGKEFGDSYLCLESLFGIDEATEEFPEQSTISPLFTVSDIKSLFALLKENSPFVPLPIPKYSSSLRSYSCYVDLPKVTFTALPYEVKNPEEKIDVMNLIYALSSDIKNSPRTLLYNNTSSSSDSAQTKAASAVKSFDIVLKSARVDLISLFNFGDLAGFMEGCINERTTKKAFMINGANRIAAAVQGMSFSLEKILK